jgi:hypothetical protein
MLEEIDVFDGFMLVRSSSSRRAEEPEEAVLDSSCPQ